MLEQYHTVKNNIAARKTYRKRPNSVDSNGFNVVVAADDNHITKIRKNGANDLAGR
jgi:hypothetical protein